MIDGATYELFRKDPISGQFFEYPSQVNVLSFVYDSNLPNSNKFSDVPGGEYRVKVKQGDCEKFGPLQCLLTRSY